MDSVIQCGPEASKGSGMKFNLFMYCTVGRPAELEAGMAGKKPELYQRMLAEIAEYVGVADSAGYAGFGHPEHHLQIEGFEVAGEPTLMSMWIGRHSERILASIELFATKVMPRFT